MEQLPVKSGDEVGRLAEAFNQMVVRLRELIQSVANPQTSSSPLPGS